MAEIEDGGDDVDEGSEGLDRLFRAEFSAGPVEHEGDAVTSVVLAALGAAHAGVEDVLADGGSIVGGENEDGIVGDAEFLEDLAGASHVFVDVGDHPVVGLLAGLLSGIHVEILLRAVERTVRGVGADVGEEGLLLGSALLDELDSVIEEDIRAESLGRNDHAIVEVVTVEVVIVPEVGSLAHPPPP